MMREHRSDEAILRMKISWKSRSRAFKGLLLGCRCSFSQRRLMWWLPTHIYSLRWSFFPGDGCLLARIIKFSTWLALWIFFLEKNSVCSSQRAMITAIFSTFSDFNLSFSLFASLLAVAIRYASLASHASERTHENRHHHHSQHISAADGEKGRKTGGKRENLETNGTQTFHYSSFAVERESQWILWRGREELCDEEGSINDGQPSLFSSHVLMLGCDSGCNDKSTSSVDNHFFPPSNCRCCCLLSRYILFHSYTSPPLLCGSMSIDDDDKKRMKDSPAKLPICSECNFSFFLCTSILFRWAVGKWEKWTKKGKREKSLGSKFTPSSLIAHPILLTAHCVVCVFCARNLYISYISLRVIHLNEQIIMINYVW